MITYREALEKILQAAPVMPAEPCRLEDATGRVLRQTIISDRAYPPFDRVMMDGYAFRFSEISTNRKLSVRGFAAAGKAAVECPKDERTCIEVATGAPLPLHTDCVIPYEEISGKGTDEIEIHPSWRGVVGSSIHRMGSDINANVSVLEEGTILGATEIGAAASFGYSMFNVTQQPRILILPTGDELVEMNKIPNSYQIRQSNGHAIRTALLSQNFLSDLHSPLSDDTQAHELTSLLENNHWILFTGAISKGTRDFLPRLLEELGCEKIFHGVAHRPGKPAGFWAGPKGQAIMALPGNPVSALTGLYTFVLPGLAASLKRQKSIPRMVVTNTAQFGLEGMTQHLPVILQADGRAQPAPTGNSGDFIGLIGSDGFISIPPRGTTATAYPFTPWR